MVEYRNRDDLKAAIAKCDGTEIRGSRITVREVQMDYCIGVCFVSRSRTLDARVSFCSLAEFARLVPGGVRLIG